MQKEELKQFTGSEHQYVHWSRLLKFTDGISYLQRKATCYWLIDTIASSQLDWKEIPFQVWRLEVSGSKGVLTMREDSGAPVLVRQEIQFTDFPMDFVELWVIDGVCILPSEY